MHPTGETGYERNLDVCDKNLGTRYQFIYPIKPMQDIPKVRDPL